MTLPPSWTQPQNWRNPGFSNRFLFRQILASECYGDHFFTTNVFLHSPQL
uniref:Uncharacterized protein n=1 Tax=Picea sitchensis TaxID=3332 RepID=A0A6B9XT08_PICSI|nr:hypothetical protein Q903MT_gene4191 [Picea sitchensis]